VGKATTKKMGLKKRVIKGGKMSNSEKVKSTIMFLQSILSWSDRLGSDEIDEIKRMLKVLEKK